MNREQVRNMLAALRYHHQSKVKNDSDYTGSTLESDTLHAISYMQELLKRALEKNRPE